MKKHIIIALTAVLLTGMLSCTKKADVAATEPNLPKIALSSLGTQQISPFTVSSTSLTFNFGATTTGATPDKFTLEFFPTTTVTGVAAKIITFPTWSGSDSNGTGSTIGFVLEPTSYPNTQVYGGTITVKLSSIGLVAGKTYSVRASAYQTGSATPVTYSVNAFFKTI